MVTSQVSYTVGGSSGNSDRDRMCSVQYGAAPGAPPSTCNVQYDELGNVVSMPTRSGSRSLEYLADGSVQRVTKRGTSGQLEATATFVYGPLGDRSAVYVDENLAGGGVRQYAAWRHGEFIESGGPLGLDLTQDTRRFSGPSGLTIERRGASGPWVFSIAEPRGGRFTLDETGAFLQDTDYEPYGEARVNGVAPSSILFTHQQWNGGEALASVGLVELGARLYDP